MRELPSDRVGEFDAREASTTVGVMERSDAIEMAGDGLAEGQWEKGCPISIAFALANDDLTSRGVEILDAEAQAFEQPQTSPVEQPANERMNSVEARENGSHLLSRHHDW
jgi:hypothetical protein